MDLHPSSGGGHPLYNTEPTPSHTPTSGHARKGRLSISSLSHGSRQLLSSSMKPTPRPERKPSMDLHHSSGGGHPLYNTELTPSSTPIPGHAGKGRLSISSSTCGSRLFLSSSPKPTPRPGSKVKRKKKRKEDYIFLEEYESSEDDSEEDDNKLAHSKREWNFEEEYDFDRVTDEEEESKDCPKFSVKNMDFHQTQIRSVYMKACKSLNIQPVAYFYQHLTDQSIRIRHHMLGSDGCKACAIALVNNDAVTDLDISDNAIGDLGASYISQTVSCNKFITSLTLSENNITNDGLQSLLSALKEHRHMLKLDISNNHFTEQCGVYLADLIEHNHTLTWLNVKGSRLGNIGGQLIGPAIGKNKALEYLDLSWNHLRLKGAIEVIKGIKENDELETVNLGWNGLSLEGCVALASALDQHSSLKSLELANNRINKDCVMHLLGGVTRNKNLIYLGLSMNPIATEGAEVVLKVIKDSPDSAIEEINLSSQTVDQKFMVLKKELQEKRGMKISHGKVLEQLALEGAGDDCLDEDPMMVLMEFMKQKNMRLVDLFASLDTDGSKSLDYGEFRDGLKTVNIPLSRDGIDKLLKRLDLNGDGEVDFKELMEGQKEFRRKVTQIQKEAKQSGLIDNPLVRISKKVSGLLKAREEDTKAKARAKLGGAAVPKKKLLNVTKAVAIFATMSMDT